MATLLGSLLISLGLESAKFKSGLTDAERSMRRSAKRIESIGRGMQDVGAKLSIAITAPLTALGVASFRAASDAAELESAFRQTFGNMSKDMEAWAVATGDAMGRSTQEIQNATNTFGIFFNTSASTRKEAAELSKTFAVLAQDLSSFYNVDPTTALEKLRSGLSGESEPLRDFGVFLTEATVKQEALRLGLAKTADGITEQNKVMARASLIMQATTNAQGDVARTADGTANRVRAARAAFEELTVAIGQKLIPALTPLITGLTNVLNAFNNLPQGVQTTVVAFGALAAVLGPLIFISGAVVQAFGVLKGSLVGTGVAATGLRATLVALLPTLALVAGAVGAVVAIIAIANKRIADGAQASEEYRRAEEEANQARTDAASLAQTLATATGKARTEALAQAKAELLLKRRLLDRAKAQLVAAKAAAQAAQSTAIAPNPITGRFLAIGKAIGLDPNANSAQAAADAKSAQNRVDNLTAAIKGLEDAINAPEPTVSGVDVGDGKKGKKSKSPTGPTGAEIQARFVDELDSYRAQIASARGQTAKNAEEAAEYELRGVELARRATLRAIESDADYSKAQKDRLKNAVELLAEEERMAVEFRKQYELEREVAEMAGTQYDIQREALEYNYDLADTQAERKRIAMDILALEQEYRRNQLEMVIASKTASDAEKARAQAILDSLGALEAQESASVGRANETDVERWMREANKTPAQMAEAVDSTVLSGLDALSSRLADNILKVESLGDAFKMLRDTVQSVIQDMLAQLIKLGIQKAIASAIGPSLFGVPGFAKGTNFAPGGLAIVGEKGPELVNLPRGSQVVPNHELKGMGGGNTYAPTFNFPGITNAREAREAGSQAARRFRQSMNGPVNY